MGGGGGVWGVVFSCPLENFSFPPIFPKKISPCCIVPQLTCCDRVVCFVPVLILLQNTPCSLKNPESHTRI